VNQLAASGLKIFSSPNNDPGSLPQTPPAPAPPTLAKLHADECIDLCFTLGLHVPGQPGDDETKGPHKEECEWVAIMQECKFAILSLWH
jgi:hypothetical protein